MLVLGPDPKPRLFFQAVPEEKVAKNRVHLDLEADDVDVMGEDYEPTEVTLNEGGN